MDTTNISKIKSYLMITRKELWGVLFLSLILSSFQMVILPSSDVDKRGWNSAHPAFSCKEILDSWHSKGDGEYWIDPEKSGNPLRVYFDMARYGGKWISLFIWDTRTLTGVYLTWSSFRTFWSWLFVLSLRRSLFSVFFNRNRKIFSNVFGYHQPADLSTTGQHTRHACNLTV